MKGNSMELNIQRFAEGGAEGASSGESAAVAQPQNTGDAGQNTADNTSVAGENNATTDNGEGNVTLDSIFEKYPELKKEADKRTQKAVQGRVHQINKSMQSQNDIIDKLMVRHGVKNVEELSEKLDSVLTEEFAVQNGLTEDMGKELLNLRTRRMQEERAREFYNNQQAAETQYNTWVNESKDVKTAYADFDLEKELENPEFVKLLKRGVPMKHTYEVLHMDEIVNAAKKETAAAYAKSTAQIQARPSENGLGNQAAVNGQKDVSKLTKKERAELAKRAQRGEIITF